MAHSRPVQYSYVCVHVQPVWIWGSLSHCRSVLPWGYNGPHRDWWRLTDRMRDQWMSDRYFLSCSLKPLLHFPSSTLSHHLSLFQLKMLVWISSLFLTFTHGIHFPVPEKKQRRSRSTSLWFPPASFIYSPPVDCNHTPVRGDARLSRQPTTGPILTLPVKTASGTAAEYSACSLCNFYSPALISFILAELAHERWVRVWIWVKYRHD